MPRVLDVNNDAVVVLSNKLEGLGPTTLSNVVRKTLNETAMDVKKNTLPESASNAFERRNKTFFKAFSRVEFAHPGKINGMSATIGMMDVGLKGSNPDAVQNLEEQEHGGTIERSIIPLESARVGKSWGRNVRKANRISTAKWVDPRNTTGTKKQQFIKSAIHAGKGGFVRGNMGSNQRFVFKVISIRRTPAGTFVKKIPVFDVEKGRSISVDATHFAEKAARKSAKGMNQRFVNLARQRIIRALK